MLVVKSICLINVNTHKKKVLSTSSELKEENVFMAATGHRQCRKLASSRLESVNFDGKNQRREGKGNEEH